jgi:predicted acylesterase/phospholipase RssA
MNAAHSKFLQRREEIEAPPVLDRFSSLRRMATDERRRFVISMGGGGVPALCGNAALAKLLEELDLRDHIAEIWGTSAGAIIGGGWASGTNADRLREILCSLRGKRMMDIEWWRLVRGVLFRRFGASFPDAILRGGRFHEAMVSGLSVQNIEDCEIPFRCIACTDDSSGRRKIFREGPLAAAISASMSLPGFLLPRDAEGSPQHGFFDGGLMEKTPLFSPVADHTSLGDERELLILGAYFGTHQVDPAHGFLERFLVTIDALSEHLWEHQQHETRRQSGLTTLMVDPHINCDSLYFNFGAIDSNYLQSREAFKDKLQNAKIALTLGSSCGPSHPCPA